MQAASNLTVAISTVAGAKTGALAGRSPAVILIIIGVL
jgi:hypothetical protein